MKNLGKFILGTFVQLASIALVFLTLMKIDIRGSAALTILVIGLILLVIIFIYFIPDRYIKYGVAFGRFSTSLFFIYGTWTAYEESNRLDTTPQSLESKATSLWTEINTLNSITTDSLAVHVTADTINEGEKVIGGEVKSFQIDLKEFKIITTKEWNKSLTKSKFEILNDTIFILHLQGGDIIKKRLEPTENGIDSTVYLGYLPQQGLFIFVENVSELGPDYSSINAVTGQIINGIPLYRYKSDNLYGSVLFRHELGQLEIPVKIWEKVNNDYKIVYEDEITLTKNYRDYNRFIISNIKWDKQDFKFKLYLDKDSIELKLRVLGI